MDITEEYKKYVATKLQRSGFTDVNSIPGSEYITAIAKNNARVCIQCFYSEFDLTEKDIKASSAKIKYGCAAAMLITNTVCTPAAKQYAGQKKIIVKENIKMPAGALEHSKTDQLNRNKLHCPNCGSENVEVQLMKEDAGKTITTSSKTESKTTKGGHGCLWWCTIGIWWTLFDAMWWILAFPFRFALQLVKKKKEKTKSNTTTYQQESVQFSYRSMCLCKNCGHHWEKV